MIINNAILLLSVLSIFFIVAPYSIQRMLQLRRQHVRRKRSQAIEETFIIGLRSLVKKNNLTLAIEAYSDFYDANGTQAKEAILNMQQDILEGTESTITRNATHKIIGFIRQGKVDEAVKLYQNTTGADLNTAKRAISQIQQADLNP